MATATLGRPLIQCKTAPPSFLPSLPTSQCLTSHFSPRRPLLMRPRGPGSKPLLAFPVGREQQQVDSYSEELTGGENWGGEVEEDYERTVSTMNYSRPCELYLCNLPRSFDIAEIAEMFRPFGTITSVQALQSLQPYDFCLKGRVGRNPTSEVVSKDPHSGQSKGAAYVTMASSDDAKKAVARLEGSDVGGREIRVRFSTEMGRGNEAEMSKKTVTSTIYQGPYQLYAGNLPWSTRPDDIWKIFKEFGAVVSVRVVNDRRTGRLRVYAFVSYNTEEELKAALSMSGKSINGRQMAVRKFGKTDRSFYTSVHA